MPAPAWQSKLIELLAAIPWEPPVWAGVRSRRARVSVAFLPAATLVDLSGRVNAAPVGPFPAGTLLIDDWSRTVDVGGPGHSTMGVCLRERPWNEGLSPDVGWTPIVDSIPDPER
jgi:hypothetical protein